MRLLRVAGAAVVLAAVAFAAIMLTTAGSGSAAGPCTMFAAPNGSDSDAGTEARPFRTVQRLSDSLSAGDVGCLRAGTYTQDVTVTRGGSSTADVTITEYPKEQATLVGRLRIHRSAPYLTIEGLSLVGIEQGNNCGRSMCPSPTVNAADVSFVGNDVTNDHRGICFLLGDANGVYGRADRVRIVGNRIHDCGRLPATNSDHGIYAQATADAIITDNYIYGNADKGINLYPDVDRAQIKRNVVYGNGQGINFSADATATSDDNVVDRNVISHANIGFNIQSYWASGSGPAGNTVTNNCLYGGNADPWYNRNGGVEDTSGAGGYTISGNVVPSSPGPGFVDATGGDFRLIGTSACLALFSATSAVALSADVPSP